VKNLHATQKKKKEKKDESKRGQDPQYQVSIETLTKRNPKRKILSSNKNWFRSSFFNIVDPLVYRVFSKILIPPSP